MSHLRKFMTAKRRRQAEDLFARRAERFQRECGWCGCSIDDDDPVVAVGARVHEGIDLSRVEGKVIEIAFTVAGKTVLAAVTGFQSEAKIEGKDIIFMVCSDDCGSQLRLVFADELARGLSIQ